MPDTVLDNEDRRKPPTKIYPVKCYLMTMWKNIFETGSCYAVQAELASNF